MVSYLTIPYKFICYIDKFLFGLMALKVLAIWIKRLYTVTCS